MATARDVSAVVCTKNAIAGIEPCLRSLRDAGVGEIIVVDAHSTDGTLEIASALADTVLTDEGTGLGAARNLGIVSTAGSLILNMGSDNVLPEGQLDVMISALAQGHHAGVSATTIIPDTTYLARGLNAWRTGRFPAGSVAVIGTPTLFRADQLRAHPYDTTRKFSDDSELCERWSREFGATFAISDAYVYELGKTSWEEIVIRCRMYGISDHEVFRKGSEEGWTAQRKVISLLHPLRVDLLTPVMRLPLPQALAVTPFLATFTGMRYAFWAKTALGR